ncbi:MAG: SpoIIE family protein phosphatase [Capsulimonadaceae bacterium]|nr:SpoIIE family protein phosphatase [Capsulimonadaceae bacterium]
MPRIRYGQAFRNNTSPNWVKADIVSKTNSFIGQAPRFSPVPPAVIGALGYVVAALSVAIATWVLGHMQRALELGSGQHLRPFGIGFMVPIIIATLAGGRGCGYFAVALSAVAIDYFLMPVRGHFSVPDYSAAIEIVLVLLSGNAMVMGLDSLRSLEPLLHESEQAAAQLRAVTDNAPVGVLLTGTDGTIRYANLEAERIMGRRLKNIRLDVCEYGRTGPPVRQRGTPIETILTPCLNGRDVEMREWPVVHAGGERLTVEARATLVRDERKRPINGLVTLTDVTERKRSERSAVSRANREALINRIGEAIRDSVNPDEIQHLAVRALGEALRIERCYFMTFDLAAGHAWIGSDFHRYDLPSLSGHYRVDEMRVRPDKFFRQGRTLVVEDVLTGLSPREFASELDRININAVIAVPMFAHEQIVALLVAGAAEAPRTWSADEVLLVEAVAAQTRSAVQLARLLIQEQKRRRDEQVSNQIAETLRYNTDPEIVLARTLQVIASALEADCCCYFDLEAEGNRLKVASEYHWAQDGLRIDDKGRLAIVNEILVENEATLVIEDVEKGPWQSESVEACRSAGLASFVAVPVFSQTQMTGVFLVSMDSSARSWKADEVRLIEQSSVQARSTFDMAKVRAREHTVAETLQRALQPGPAADPATFEIAYFYQPALDEAFIGGDFYDVYQPRPGCHAIVIGDVSGKGIAAAAQIASVRNMLHYALDHEADLAGGLTRLNESLARSSQLAGFATLFVGLYDKATCELTYGSCGHEPAILLTSRGDIELLGATGPPVGAIETARYEQRTVGMHPGDILVLYTDGISEAGPNRRSLLGSDGVVDIVKRRYEDATPAELIERLMADVKAYSNGVLRDDVCVVAALVQPVAKQDAAPALAAASRGHGFMRLGRRGGH